MKPILFILLCFCIFSCTSTKIFIVRHAEKAGMAANADLKSPEGFARANTLRDSLKKYKLDGVFSTNVPRTFHTGKPTADDQHLSVVFYANSDSLIDKISLKKNKCYLVVGHSNTVPQMIRRLGLDPDFIGDIPDSDFDNLYVISIFWRDGERRMSVARKTYGVATP